MDLADWSPRGRFTWRYASRFGGFSEQLQKFAQERWERSPLGEFVRTGMEKGSDWELLKAGFFNGSIERFRQIVETYNKPLQNR